MESLNKNKSGSDCQTPVVVIGGGIAGVSCIEILAQELGDRQLILISCSPLIKVVSNLKTIGNNIQEFDVCERDSNYLENKYKNVKVIVDKIVSINSSEHDLTLESGCIVKYDKLCVCCGGKPKIIEEENSDIREYVLGIRDVETVDNFQRHIKSAKRVVIVGNGGIATELVYEIQNCSIVWSVRDDNFGATFFDSIAAKFFENKLNNEKSNDRNDGQNISKRLKYTVSHNPSQSDDQFGSALGPDWALGLDLCGKSNKNVKIEFNCEVNCVYKTFETIPDSKKQLIQSLNNIKDCDNDEHNSWPIYVELTNDRIYGCDFIVSATGVTPNSQQFLSGNNFKLGGDGGLEVNNEMQTNESDIYAAGDVCTVGWTPSEFWFQMRLWTQARLMGVYAGYCISSHIKNMSPLLYFNFEVFTHVTKFFGYKVVLLGLFNGQKLNNNYEILVRITPQQEMVKVIMRSGKMLGAILIGETDLEETFENLISNQIDLSPYGDDLLNSNIDIDDYFD